MVNTTSLRNAAAFCFFLAFVPSTALAGAAAALPEIKPVYDERPFPTRESLSAFQGYVDRLSLRHGRDIKIPSEFWQSAPATVYWGFSFEPNSVGTYDVTFEQRFDAQEIFNSIRATLNGLRVDGCSYFSAGNAQVTALEKNRIVFFAELSGKKRWCGDYPWGGSWKIDAGDISGRITGSLTFRTEILPGIMRYNGQVSPNPPQVSIDVDLDSIFGINTSTVAGQILSAVTNLPGLDVVFTGGPVSVTAWQIISAFSSDLYRVPGTSLVDGEFLEVTDGAVTSARYREFLQNIRGLVWAVQPYFVIDDAKTGLAFPESGPMTMNVAFTTRLKEWEDIDSILEDVNVEVNLIASFRQPKTVHVIKRGETLWSIAQKTYGNGFYYHMLGSANGLDRQSANKIRTGKLIEILPMHAISPVAGVHFMAPGETIYGLCLKWMPGSFGGCWKALRSINPTLSLRKAHILERIVVPTHFSQVENCIRSRGGGCPGALSGSSARSEAEQAGRPRASQKAP